MRHTVLLVAFCVLAASNFSLGKCDDTTNLFILPPGYENAQAPRGNQSGQNPYFIELDLEIWAINEISLRRQDIEVDFSTAVRWIDPRLAVNPNISSPDPWIMIRRKEVEKIWTPTIVFRNCKGCVPVSWYEGRDLFVNINTVLIYGKVRMHKAFTCAIDLRAYPMDIQFCQLQIFSYQGTTHFLQLRHSYPDTEISIQSNLTLAEYYTAPIIKSQCVVKYAEGEAFPCLELRIRLEHLIGFHLMTLYAPTTFIVVLSWISFWLPVELAPARVALGLTSLLTLTTRLDQAQKDLPPVAYVKAIDVWMFACIFLVSMSLCEFAFSHYKAQIYKTRSKVEPTMKIQNVSVKSNPLISSGAAVVFPTDKLTDKNGSMLFDKISRIIFPLAFLIFNIAYWSRYLTYYNN